MRRINLIEAFKYTFAIAVFSAGFLSCEVGLGPAVDLAAPELTIDSPVATGSVARNFMVRGSVSDNTGVKDLTVSFEETGQKFRWSNGIWQKYDKTSNCWMDYPEATFEGTEEKFAWSVPVEFPADAKSGVNYTMTTVANDNYGNEGSKSKDERTFTVDINDPIVSIIVPSLMNVGVAYRDYNAIKSTSDGYSLNDSMSLQKLINKDFTIDGTQKEDARLDKLYVMIDKGTSETVASYSSQPELELIADSLILKRQLEGSRTWSTSVSEDDIPEECRNGRHLFRLITESHDLAGNVERKVQGWFTYDNDADKPWIVSTFGDDEYKENDQKEVYPGCSLQGQAYDDDGIKSIEIRVYVNEDGKWNLVEDKNKNQDINLEDENFPTYHAWSLNAISENRHFKVVAKCVDVNGIESETITRYLAMADVNPPKLEILSPANGSTVIGDANGDFTITGKVTDNGSLVGISKLLMVRIANNQRRNMFSYFDSEYDGWKMELNGNKIFEIDLAVDSASGLDEEENGYYKYSFSRTFNIFSDFGISSEEVIGSNSFLFKVNDDKSSTIDSYSLQGDTQAPVLTIDKVTVRKGLSETDYSFENDNQPTLIPFERNSSGITDKIYYSGTWSDNSTSTWNKDTSGNSRIENIQLKSGNATIPVTMNDDGTWKSDSVVPADTTTASVVATLKDWGGNEAKTSASYYVSSSNPTLIRISSLNPDGSYKAGDVITITMEFNKKVTFSGSGATLNLNNRKTAVYDSSSNTNGSAKHYYKYTVESGDDIEKLNVDSINKNGFEWKDADGAEIDSDDEKKFKLDDVLNLEDVRSLKIDTGDFKISSVLPISNPGYYKAGKELFFVVNFNKDATFSDLNALKIKIKIGSDEKILENPTQTSSTSLMYKYTTSDGDNGIVSFESFDKNGCIIEDKAKNPLSTVIPVDSNWNTVGRKIEVDTAVPRVPVVNGVSDNELVYAIGGKTVSVTGFEPDAEKYYSVDDGVTWVDYTGDISLTANGTYKVKVYQIDKAGNKSDESVMKIVTLDTGNILTSITSSVPDGTYTTGKILSITLNFRKEVIVTGSKLKLSIRNKMNSSIIRYAIPDVEPVGGAKSITYKYTVDENDECLGDLEVEDFIKSTITDATEQKNNISDYVPLPSIGSGNRLSDNRSIRIVTGAPKIESVEFSNDGKKINIAYSVEVSKKTGNITFKMKPGTFVAPIVMTSSEYADCDDDIKKYYEEGTSGMTKSGTSLTSDLSKKYILKYSLKDVDPAKDGDLLPTNSDLISLFITAGKDTVTVPIDSTAVTITGTRNNILSIDISDAYKLPVKGAEYVLTVPAGIVKNVLEVSSIAIGTDYSNIRAPGVESPVIRIKKSREIIMGEGTNATIAQPLTAKVRIDCRTNGATIKYVDASKTSNQKTFTGTTIVKDTSSDNSTAVADSAISNDFTNEFEVGKNNDYTKGYKVLVAAKAVLGTDKTGENYPRNSEVSYEAAYRTVVTFEETADRKDKTEFFQNYHRWIRGGDWTMGGVSTPGFPLSWDKSETSKIHAMTPIGNATEVIKVVNENGRENNVQFYIRTFYWVSWEINTTAYVGFLVGDMPSDASTNGPKNWCWGSCSWVGNKNEYPVYPGESLKLQDRFPTSYCEGEGSKGRYGYQDKHKESR